ncbi:Uncharacterized protein Rs2_43048 [Raphanus sativus]|nr:Uncharacterized protein Rs2_43048 [Raphanus sativus]
MGRKEEAGVIEYNTLLNSLKTRRDSLGSKLSELLEAKSNVSYLNHPSPPIFVDNWIVVILITNKAEDGYTPATKDNNSGTFAFGVNGVEELKEEKLKAKEEAEDLTQEMAELRYKMTCLLDEERKRRVCIEQASLQRIAELEAQAYAIFWPCFFFFFF